MVGVVVFRQPLSRLIDRIQSAKFPGGSIEAAVRAESQVAAQEIEAIASLPEIPAEIAERLKAIERRLDRLKRGAPPFVVADRVIDPQQGPGTITKAALSNDPGGGSYTIDFDNGHRSGYGADFAHDRLHLDVTRL